ncbi:MAG: hypothetical protein ACREN3_10950, partial [Gemmatimonadaceae bacterium]
ADSALAPLEVAGTMGTRRNPTSSVVNAMLAYTYARVGDVERAQAISKAAAAAKSPDAAMISAHALLGAGDTSGALAALDTAARAHAPLLSAESLAEPIFDPIRTNPRFLRVLQALGLPDTLAHHRPPAP